MVNKREGERLRGEKLKRIGTRRFLFLKKNGAFKQDLGVGDRKDRPVAGQETSCLPQR